MSTVSVALTPKNLPALLKRGTATKEILKMVKKAPKDVLSRRDDSGQTLLHVAAAEGELELVQKLVEKFKANLEDRDKNDWRPLHSAALGKMLDVMQFLLKAGASPAATNVESATALHYFAKVPPPASATDEPLYQDVLSRLIHKSGHINIQNKSGQTALHKAVLERTERTLLIHDLLTAKADVLLPDANGETVAHIVARNGNKDMFEKLLRVGGAPLLLSVSKNGETPLSVARSANHEHLANFITQWASSHGVPEHQLVSTHEAMSSPHIHSHGTSPSLSSSSAHNTTGHINSNNSFNNSNGAPDSQQQQASSIEYFTEDPTDDPDTAARRNGIRRINIVKLLVAGEQILVQQLKWVNSTVAEHVKEHYSSFSISLVELNTIFNSELTPLFKKHRSILEVLRTRLKDFRGDHNSWGVGDAFAELHALRPHYKLFAAAAEESVLACKRLMASNAHFAALIARTVETSKNVPPRAADLPSLLLAPLERVCSYSSLLRDLHAVTPEGHPDRTHLELAMDYGSQIASDVLSVKRAAITKARVLAIEEALDGFNQELYKHGREFVCEDYILVKQLSAKGKQPPQRCVVYLFNDLVMWAKKAGASNASGGGGSGGSGSPSGGANTSSSATVGGGGSGGIGIGGGGIGVGVPPLLGSIAAAASFNASTFSTINQLFVHTSNPNSLSSEPRVKPLVYCNSMSLKYVSTVTGTTDPDMKHAFEVSNEKENMRFVFGCESDEARLAWISRICNQVSRVSLYQMWNTQNSLKGPSKRVSHTATVVGSRLYVFGGQYQNHYYNDMYIYHLENREWTKVPMPASSAAASSSAPGGGGGGSGGEGGAAMPTPRCEHSAVAVNSRIIYFGGFDGQKRLKDLYVFDTTTLKWTKPAIQSKRVPGGRSGHKMVFFHNLVWLFGGIDSHGTYLNDIYTLNLEKWQWSSVPIEGKMPAPRAFHSMDVLKTKIAVFGGYSFSKCHDDVALLDTKKRTWTIVRGEELKATAFNAGLGSLGSGLGSMSSKTTSAAGSTKLLSSSINPSSSSGAVSSASQIGSSSSNAFNIGESELVAPQGRYHHASFVVDDYILVQGGLDQGTSSFCDLWALTTIDEQVVWHPVPIALQLDHRFRHTISAFKNKTSGKIQAIMFGGISGLATSSVHPHDVIVFKDMEMMVASLMKNYRRTVRRVAAISKADLLSDTAPPSSSSSPPESYSGDVRRDESGGSPGIGKWGGAPSSSGRTTSTRNSNSPTIGRERVGGGSSTTNFNMGGVIDNNNSSSAQTAPISSTPSSSSLCSKDPSDSAEVDNLPLFSTSMADLSHCRPDTDIKLCYSLDSQKTMWAAKHVPTNTSLMVTTLKLSRAHGVASNMADIISSIVPNGVVPYYAAFEVGEEVWILQELALCSAAGVVRTLGVTLPESTLALIARQTLESIAQMHKVFQSPCGICPEFLTLNAQAQVRLAHCGIYDFIKDGDKANKSSKEKEKATTYSGQLFDAPEIFIAPETFEARHNQNAKSVNGEKADIYSLGLSLLFLFTGSIPTPLLPSAERANAPLAALLPNVGPGSGQVSSSFREFLMHSLEYSGSKRPITKTLLDHSFVGAVRNVKSDSTLQEYVNMWKLYRGKGKGEGKPRDGYDMARKFKPSTSDFSLNVSPSSKSKLPTSTDGAIVGHAVTMAATVKKKKSKNAVSSSPTSQSPLISPIATTATSSSSSSTLVAASPSPRTATSSVSPRKVSPSSSVAIGRGRGGGIATSGSGTQEVPDMEGLESSVGSLRDMNDDTDDEDHSTATTPRMSPAVSFQDDSDAGSTEISFRRRPSETGSASSTTDFSNALPKATSATPPPTHSSVMMTTSTSTSFRHGHGPHRQHKRGHSDGTSKTDSLISGTTTSAVAVASPASSKSRHHVQQSSSGSGSGASTHRSGGRSKASSSVRQKRHLRRQNTYDQSSGAVVSRAYADEEKAFRYEDDEEDRRGPMHVTDEDDDFDDTWSRDFNDDSAENGDEYGDRRGGGGRRGRQSGADSVDYEDVDSDGGYDEDDDDEEYGYRRGGRNSEPLASLSQLRLLQEEYMEVQQSTAESQSRMANELAEVRMKLSIAQNELASAQAEFERRVEERVEREISSLKVQMNKVIETKVQEVRDANEARFVRQLELVKHQLGEEFRALQRDLHRYMAFSPSSPHHHLHHQHNEQQLLQHHPQSPAASHSASIGPTLGSGGGVTGGGNNPRTTPTPLWKTRVNGRTSQPSLFASPGLGKFQASSSSLNTLEESSIASDFVRSKTSSPALLSSSALFTHPKSLSDPAMTTMEAESKRSTNIQEREQDGVRTSSSGPLPSSSAAPTPSSSQPSSTSAASSANDFPITTTSVSATSSSLSQSAPSHHTKSNQQQEQKHSAQQHGQQQQQHGQPQQQQHQHQRQHSPTESSLESSLGTTTTTTSPSPIQKSPSSSGIPLTKSPSTDGMSEAAREATLHAAVDVSLIWAVHGKGVSPGTTRKS